MGPGWAEGGQCCGHTHTHLAVFTLGAQMTLRRPYNNFSSPFPSVLCPLLGNRRGLRGPLGSPAGSELPLPRRRGLAAPLTAPAALAGSLRGGRPAGAAGHYPLARQGSQAGTAEGGPGRAGSGRGLAGGGGAGPGVTKPPPRVPAPRAGGRAEGGAGRPHRMRRRAGVAGSIAAAPLLMVLSQGGQGDAAPAAGGQEPEVPPHREDGPGAVQPCLCPAPGVEAAAAGTEERRACGCCSGASWPFCCCEAPGEDGEAAGGAGGCPLWG